MSGRRGFTLLELLLAITLLGVVVAIAFSSFQAGLGSYRRGTAVAAATASARGAAALLAADLERALPIGTSTPRFESEELWLAVAAPSADGTTLRRVRYAIAGGRLWRLEDRLEGSVPAPPPIDLGAGTDLRFTYRTEAGWTDRAETWPHAVRLTGSFVQEGHAVAVRTAVALAAPSEPEDREARR